MASQSGLSSLWPLSEGAMKENREIDTVWLYLFTGDEEGVRLQYTELMTREKRGVWRFTVSWSVPFAY